MKTMKKAKILTCEPFGKAARCYAVEALVTVDERDQMILTKELRTKAGIMAGDKQP